VTFRGTIAGNVADVTMIHRDAVLSARKALPDEELLFELAEFFKVFGDTTRVRILYALQSYGALRLRSLRLCCLSHSLAISHQLRLLKAARLVPKSSRKARSCYYLS